MNSLLLVILIIAGSATACEPEPSGMTIYSALPANSSWYECNHTKGQTFVPMEISVEQIIPKPEVNACVYGTEITALNTSSVFSLGNFHDCAPHKNNSAEWNAKFKGKMFPALSNWSQAFQVHNLQFASTTTIFFRNCQMKTKRLTVTGLVIGGYKDSANNNTIPILGHVNATIDHGSTRNSMRIRLLDSSNFLVVTFNETVRGFTFNFTK